MLSVGPYLISPIEQVELSASGFSMRCAQLLMSVYTPYMSHTLDLSCAQNLKPHDDESKDCNDDNKYDAFAEELESN